MKVLDLFSGIGGFSLGLERAGMQTVAFCEIEPFCQRVLQKHWPDTPIINDVKNINATELKKYGIESIDLICGGFPCQPFSVAGKKKGKQDDRDLWPEMFRIIKELQPRWIIGENVANFVNMEFTRTKIDLESEGYSVQPFIIPACAVEAPHQRNRIWIVAHNNSQRTEVSSKRQQSTKQMFGSSSAKRALANAESLHAQGQLQRQRQGESWGSCWREVEPAICRSDDEVSNRVDRLKSLGNAVVPEIPEIIGRFILEIDS